MIALLLVLSIAQSPCDSVAGELLVMTSSAAEWKEAALAYRDAALLWKRNSRTRDERIKTLEMELAGKDVRIELLEHAVEARPAPERIDVTPAWVPIAIGAAAVLGAGIAVGIYEMLGPDE